MNTPEPITSARLFSASREDVFQAFSNPERLALWWGPKGFRNTFKEFGLRPGGMWRFVMHGPDGSDYENVSEFIEVVPPQRIVFRRNQFIRNRGFASVGLLLKACDDVLAEDNLLADNARGIFMEGSSRNIVRRNVIAGSDAAVVLYDSVSKNQFESNSFVSNRTPLLLVGTRTDTIFTGNYYTSNLEPDLDGDGASDRAFTLGSVFDHFRGNVIAADLMVDTPAAEALGLAERTFPVLRKIAVADDHPLAKAPELTAVPVAARVRGAASLLGILVSAGLMLLGLAGFHLGQRPGGAA